MSEFVDQLEHELLAASRHRLRIEAARVPRPGPAITTLCVSLLVCVAVTLAVVQATGSRSGSHRPSAPRPTIGHRSQVARPVNAQIAANFAPFRRPRTRADFLPATAVPVNCLGPAWNGGPHAAEIEGLGAYRQIFCGRGPAHLSGGRRTLRRVLGGLQRNQARAVLLPRGLGKVWMVPSGRWLCNLWRQSTSFSAMTCETVTVVLAHPPLWPGGMWCLQCGPSDGANLIALEPDKVTHVTHAYPGGSKPAYLANNVVITCVGLGSSWLEQTGPTISGTITTFLGGGKLNGQPAKYHPRKCFRPR